MEYINKSTKSLNANLDKKGLKKLIILPDYSPGKGRLPNGSVAIYSANEHSISGEFLGPDIGCGMLLARFGENLGDDLAYANYGIFVKLREARKASLGSGNHFINIYKVETSNLPNLDKEDNVVLIHSGSRLYGRDIFGKRLVGERYVEAHEHAQMFARQNRQKLLEIVMEASATETDTLLDIPHNTVELNNGEVIYRKGAVKLKPGEISIISSYLGGKAIIVRAKPKIEELEWSMCHGTGRKISRSDAKEIPFDSTELRKRIHIPNTIYDDSIDTEAPHCYRDIEEIFPRVEDYIEVVAELKPLSYVS